MSGTVEEADELVREKLETGLRDVATAVDRLSHLTQALQQASGGKEVIEGINWTLSRIQRDVEILRQKLHKKPIGSLQPDPNDPNARMGVLASPTMSAQLFGNPSEPTEFGDAFEDDARGGSMMGAGPADKENNVRSQQSPSAIPPSSITDMKSTNPQPKPNDFLLSFDDEQDATVTILPALTALPLPIPTRLIPQSTSASTSTSTSRSNVSPTVSSKTARSAPSVSTARTSAQIGHQAGNERHVMPRGSMAINGQVMGSPMEDTPMIELDSDAENDDDGRSDAMLDNMPSLVPRSLQPNREPPIDGSNAPQTSKVTQSSSTQPDFINTATLQNGGNAIPSISNIPISKEIMELNLLMGQASDRTGGSAFIRRRDSGSSYAGSDVGEIAIETDVKVDGNEAGLKTVEVAKIQLPPSPTASEEVRKVWGDVGMMGLYDGLDKMGMGMGLDGSRMDELVVAKRPAQNFAAMDDMEVFLGLGTASPAFPGPIVAAITKGANSESDRTRVTTANQTSIDTEGTTTFTMQPLQDRSAAIAAHLVKVLPTAHRKEDGSIAETSSIQELALLEAENVEISAEEAAAVAMSKAELDTAKSERLAVVIVDAHDVLLMPDRVLEGFNGATRFLQDLTKLCRDLLPPNAQSARLEVKIFLDTMHVCRQMYTDTERANEFFSGITTELDVERVEIKGHGERHNQVLGEIAKQLHNDDCVSVFVAAECSAIEVLDLKLSIAHPSKLIGLVKSKPWDDHFDAISLAPPKVGRLLTIVDSGCNERLNSPDEVSIRPPPPAPKKQAVPGIDDWAQHELSKDNEWALDEYLKGQRPTQPEEEATKPVPLYDQLVPAVKPEPLPLQMVTMSQLAPKKKKTQQPQPSYRAVSDRGPKPSGSGSSTPWHTAKPDPVRTPGSQPSSATRTPQNNYRQAPPGDNSRDVANRWKMRTPEPSQPSPYAAPPPKDTTIVKSPLPQPSGPQPKALLPQWLALLETLWYFDRMRGIAYGAHERYLIADQMKPKFGGYFGSGYYGYPTFDSLIQRAAIEGWIRIGRSIGEYTIQAAPGTYDLAGL